MGKPSLFLLDHYNVKPFEKTLSRMSLTPSIARIVNSVMEATNGCKTLPKYLLIVMDMDVLSEVTTNEFRLAHKELRKYVEWVTRQIDIVIRRKRIQLQEKKPGTLLTPNQPAIIFIEAVKHMDHYPEGSKMAQKCTLRGKFNELANEAAAKWNWNCLSICSLNSTQYFDARGGLS